MPERLQKLLAAAGVASRRAAEELIRQGRVAVDGQPVLELGTRADPATQRITVDGRPLPERIPHVYIALHKPAGYVTTRADPHAERTVMELVLPRLRGILGDEHPAIGGLHPVGRLDADSAGLLLLSNDGEFTQRLTHPRHGLPKLYRAVVKGSPAAEALQKLRAGIPLDGRRTAPARARVVSSDRGRDTSIIELELREGRNRQARRMLHAVGLPVVRLTRTRLGPVHLGRLRRGKWRFLSETEIAALTTAAPAASPLGRRRQRRK